MDSRVVLLVLGLCSVLTACQSGPNEQQQVKAVVGRYNQLLIQGYKTMNMNPLQEVATQEQAEKLYSHMAAVGEGMLRLDSNLKDISYKIIELPRQDHATVETKEIWDFTHFDIKNNKVFAQEKDFVYEMGYTLNKVNGRWLITNVVTVSGTSTNTVVPWPKIDRQGNRTYPAGKAPENPKPAAHP